MPNKSFRLLLMAVIAMLGASSAATLAQKKPRTDLQTQAKSKGGQYVWRYRPNRSVVYPNLEELAKRSDIIVVGRTVGHRSNLTTDGKFITQDFLVRVQEVFKGDVRNGTSITISLPGGSYKFKDGTRVHVMPALFKQAQDGNSYVFFLRSSKNSASKGYRLVSETQGLFGFKDGKVEPAYGAASDPMVMKYQGMAPSAFLARLHAALPKNKK
jgi:hypothetical protein